MINPAEIFEKLVMLGDEWCEANCSADLLEESRKSLISQLTQQFLLTYKSRTEMESAALRHPDYIAHVESMVTARKAANKARVRYDSAKVYSELLRTNAASERAAMGRAT